MILHFKIENLISERIDEITRAAAFRPLLGVSPFRFT